MNAVTASSSDTIRADKSDGISALVIDDHCDNLELISILLSDLSVDAKPASSADEGIEILKRAHTDLVICDISMPEKSGFDFIRECRSLGYTKPVVALTAHVSPDDRDIILQAGFNDFLAKPTTTKLLSEMIARYSNGKPSSSAALLKNQAARGLLI